ncbi:hypothetical protein FB451DRAFT_1162622 [Mycena latifolia]|nr:hypothetical protein FB451DRAFT_1162622 [Mycena latifolia]
MSTVSKARRSRKSLPALPRSPFDQTLRRPSAKKPQAPSIPPIVAQALATVPACTFYGHYTPEYAPRTTFPPMKVMNAGKVLTGTALLSAELMHHQGLKVNIKSLN